MLEKLLQVFSYKQFQAQRHRDTLQGTEGNLPQTYNKPQNTFSTKLIPSGLHLLLGISTSLKNYLSLGEDKDGETKERTA